MHLEFRPISLLSSNMFSVFLMVYVCSPKTNISTDNKLISPIYFFKSLLTIPVLSNGAF